MLKAVLFDMDGVLINSEPEYMKTNLKLARQNGIPLSPAGQKTYRGVGAIEMWTELSQKHGVAVDPLVLSREGTEHMNAYYQKGALRPIRASVRLLKSCAESGLKVAIATSSSLGNASDVVRRLGIGEYVHAISVREMVERGKPAPDIFLLAAKMLGASPAECVVIEDAEKGVEAAKAADIKTVGLMGRDSGQNLSKADIVVNSLRCVSVEMLKSMVE